jgi:serine/threonine protein kinase
MDSHNETSRLTLAEYIRSPITFYWSERGTIGTAVDMNYRTVPQNLTRGSFTTVLRHSGKSYIQLVELRTADDTSDFVVAKVMLRPSDEQKLYSEMNLLREIRHNHVAAVIGSFTRPSGPRKSETGVLIYPLAVGNLDGLLQDISDHNQGNAGNWSPHRSTQKLLPYFACLCKTVQYLHKRERPVKHRDIKPENILVDRVDNIILADFDISKAYDGVDEAITYGSRDGTVMYSSRDVWSANIEDGPQATERGLEWDIVSLGFVFLEMATVILGKSLVEMRAGMKITRPGNPPKDEVVYSVALENGAIDRWLAVLESIPRNNPRRLPKRFAELSRNRPTYAKEFLEAIRGMMLAGRNDQYPLEWARNTFSSLAVQCPLCH